MAASCRGSVRFLSTPSARRATRQAIEDIKSDMISIHALREEGDPGAVILHHASVISIHALREEGDQIRVFELILVQDFYPRPPRGGRQLTSCCFSGS